MENLVRNERHLKSEEDPVFGRLEPLKVTQPFHLPTYRMVGKAIAFERGKRGMIRNEFGGKDGVWSNDEVYTKVVEDLIYIQFETNLPRKLLMPGEF